MLCGGFIHGYSTPFGGFAERFIARGGETHFAAEYKFK